MKKGILLCAIVLALAVGGLWLFNHQRRERDRAALAAYKAQLRAQGEWLTLADAGYPFPLETNANLEEFVALANRLSGLSSLPAQLDYEPIAEPGKVKVVWRLPQLPAYDKKAPPLAWDPLRRDCAAAAPLLAALRTELENPPRRFGWNYTNPFASTPRHPFVPKRIVAQFLAADTLIALRDTQPSRARSNLHALTQLAQVHREDLPMITSMIRVAIAELGLQATTQALAEYDWQEADLAALQKFWEAVDLSRMPEKILEGERILNDAVFDLINQASLPERHKLMSIGGSGEDGLKKFKDWLVERAVVTGWLNQREADEHFYLQHMQSQLEIARQLNTNRSGHAVMESVRAQNQHLAALRANRWNIVRHLHSIIAVPNYERAFEIVLKAETRRRLTITAITLRRHTLRHGRPPEMLNALVPEFLAAVPLDPWSGTPLRYRRAPDGTFTLYSVGQDGVDDGGDPAPAEPGVPPEFGNGRDLVWPQFVHEEK